MAKHWAKKLRVIRDSDAMATGYDAQYGSEQAEKFEATLNLVKLEPEAVVLDVGCGTGLLLERIMGNSEFVVGVDFSRGMLRVAKEKLRLFPNVGLVCADSDFLPFCEGVFSNVFAVTLLQNMPNPMATCRELVRVAKKNALFVVTGLKKSFTLNEFKKLVGMAGFRLVSIADEGEVKDYVAVCQR